DRFRMAEFPEPTSEHLPALIPPLMAELAASRSLDPRFIAPLAQEDLTFLARNWQGGSIRRLSRLIEAVINARERAMPTH
ncbi:MAG: AAA family ATPase, partial [Caldilineaceae bacterium]